MCEVKFVVGVGEKAGAAVVAALNDVDRHLGDGDPGTTGMAPPATVIAEERKAEWAEPKRIRGWMLIYGSATSYPHSNSFIYQTKEEALRINN